MSTLHVFLLEGVPQDRVGPGDSIVVYSTVVSTEMSYTRMPSSYQVRSVPPPSTLCIYGGGGWQIDCAYGESLRNRFAIFIRTHYIFFKYYGFEKNQQKKRMQSCKCFASSLFAICLQFCKYVFKHRAHIRNMFTILQTYCQYQGTYVQHICNLTHCSKFTNIEFDRK
jgi:hypothetical protein